MVELSGTVKPDAEALLANLRREGTPRRVHLMELYLDDEVQEAIGRRFGLTKDLSEDDPYFVQKRHLAVHRFLGYDHVFTGIPVPMPLHRSTAEDTAELAHNGGRNFQDEHIGPITSWEDFEQYPWPDVAKASDRSLVWYQENLPDDMCAISNCNAHFAEWLTWLMGYETLCYALYENRDLVAAIAAKIRDIAQATLRRVLEFDCVKAIWGSDDMGFKTSTMISPADLREFVLGGHKMAVEMTHAAGRLYLLHCCGNIGEVMPDLIDDVKIDAKHSFEDTIEQVTDAKAAYGDQIALLGGIDVDFLCRADELAIRKRVRRSLDVCMDGGGYCLGTGNSVANYIPVDNYLAMLDEGRRWSR